MCIDLLLAALAGLAFIPLLTAYCAASYGRSFWLWLMLGCVLPIVSFYLLLALLYRSDLSPGQRLLTEAREILAAAEVREKQATLEWLLN